MTFPIGGGPLGCASDYTALLTFRGGARTAGDLDGITTLGFDRRMNDTGLASLTVSKKDLTPSCRAILAASASAEPWMYEVTIYRDEELAWQGPLISSIEDDVSLQLAAQDVTAWLAVRLNRAAYDYSSAGLNPAALAAQLSAGALAADDPGIAAWIVADTTGSELTYRAALAESAAVLTTLSDMAKTTLAYTAVGRRLWFSTPSRLAAGSVVALSPDSMEGPIVVHKDGGLFASRIMSAGSGVVSYAPPTATGQTYDSRGLVERIITNQIIVQADADATAAAALAGAQSTTYVRVQDGCVLTPTAPVAFDQLVPGVMVRLRSPDDYLTQVDEMLQLSRVTVGWAGGQEQIGVSLVPMAGVST